MITINNIDIYRDGGSIGIDGYIYHGEYDRSTYRDREPVITIDYSIGTRTPGEWYLGWKNKGAPIIQDNELKLLVKEAIQNQINHLQRTLERINNL